MADGVAFHSAISYITKFLTLLVKPTPLRNMQVEFWLIFNLDVKTLLKFLTMYVCYCFFIQLAKIKTESEILDEIDILEELLEHAQLR